MKTREHTGTTLAFLIGLMLPFMVLVLNNSMFRVAVPMIRGSFLLQADTTAWLDTAYTLPYMMLMPMFGRLADSVGKGRLFLIGICIFALGIVVAMTASGYGVMLLGRILQGVGTAGVHPLSIAIISERYTLKERGRPLGYWNASGTVTAILGPVLAGFIVDKAGWRAIYIPILVMAAITLVVVWKRIPMKKDGERPPRFFRTFDWIGTFLLFSGITLMVFYLSSRPITGVMAMRDWRLLVPAVLLFSAFVLWEKRSPNPLLGMDLFSNRSFVRASICSGIRMFLMGSLSFLIPLYLADVHSMTASQIGLLMTGHAVSLLVTISVGGRLADRWRNRWLILAGGGVSALVFTYLGLLPSGISIAWVIAGLIVHGLSAGIYLAAVHRTALASISPDQSGSASGLYSMIRYSGLLLGPALAGVLLYSFLNSSQPMILAYQKVFLLISPFGLINGILSWGIRE